MDGVVEAIASAETPQEVDAIVQDYMGGGDQAKQLVQDFLRAQGRSVMPSGSNPATSGSSSQSQSAIPSKHTAEVHRQHAKKGVKEGQRQGGALTIKHTAARKGKGGEGAGKAGPPGSDLERKVVNCLCCGKVYDFRLAGAGQLTNDLLRFLEYGGLCTFCGAQLAMSYNEQSQTNQSQTPPLPVPATPTQDPPALQATASSQVITSRVENPDETKEADAVAFKDRLVGYDRNAAQRTKVIDDQSDYFEIDSNTWLSQQERNELKARARDEAAAQEARKNKVTITVDLLGRQVLMSDSPEARQLEASAAPSTAGTAQQSDPEATSTSALAVASAAAAIAPWRGQTGATPQVGSHALRIASNPNLPGPPPMFIKHPMQQLADTSGTSASTSRRNDQGQNSALDAGAGGSTANAGMQQLQAESPNFPIAKDGPRGSTRQARMPSKKQSNRPARLQHDDPFLAYDVVVA